MAKMTSSELMVIVSSEIEGAQSEVEAGKISDDRVKAIEYYNGEPFGTEKPGRSSVISRDVLETVESILPSLLRIFMAGGVVGKFEPTKAEEDSQAKQATDYVDVVFMKDNAGFLNLYSMFKDALMLKTGVLKHWWESKDTVDQQKYTGLSQVGLQALMADKKAKDVEITFEEEENEDIVVADGEADVVTTFMATVKRTVKKEGVRIMSVSPEDLTVSGEARFDDFENTRFVNHRIRTTESALIQEGFSKELIQGLPTFNESDDSDEDLARDEDLSKSDEQIRTDSAMRTIVINESYILVDFDDDGIAERRKVVTAGDGSAITELSNEAVSAIPFSVIVPFPSPQRFYGKSIADLVVDFQRIKSSILRQMIDNLHIVNNPQKAVVETQANIDDLLQNDVGGIIRVKSQGAVQNLEVPFTAANSFPMLQYFDDVMKAGRTGISKATTGLDPNVLNSQTATAVDGMLSAGQERIEMIARIFAETGVKRVFEEIYKLIVQNMDRERTIRVRGEWVPIDPREWNSSLAVDVNVGLGTGDKQLQAKMLQDIIGVQGDLSRLPGQTMVQPVNVFNAVRDLARVGDINNIDDYLTNPENNPEKEQAPKADPALLAAQAKAQQQKFEQDLKVQDQQFEQRLSEAKAEQEIKLANVKAANQMEVDKAKAAAQAQTNQQVAEFKAELELEEAAFKADLRTAELEAEIVLEGKKIDAGTADGNANIPQVI